MSTTPRVVPCARPLHAPSRMRDEARVAPERWGAQGSCTRGGAHTHPRCMHHPTQRAPPHANGGRDTCTACVPAPGLATSPIAHPTPVHRWGGHASAPVWAPLPVHAQVCAPSSWSHPPWIEQRRPGGGGAFQQKGAHGNGGAGSRIRGAPCLARTGRGRAEMGAAPSRTPFARAGRGQKGRGGAVSHVAVHPRALLAQTGVGAYPSPTPRSCDTLACVSGT